MGGRFDIAFTIKKQDFASFGHARRKIDNDPTMK
jgi:hypothetical protein